MTRRELRQHRVAQAQDLSRPVPLQSPTPKSSDRTVADVLGTVAAIEGQKSTSEPKPDAAAIEQATAADGSPDAIEPLADAVAHSDEPRRHRSTWSPPPGVAGASGADDSAPAQSSTRAPARASSVEGRTETSTLETIASGPDSSGSAGPGADAIEHGVGGAARDQPAAGTAGTAQEIPAIPGLPNVASAERARTPGVFPLDLEADTNEVPSVNAQTSSSSGSASAGPSSSGSASGDLSAGDAPRSQVPSDVPSQEPTGDVAGARRTSSPVEPKPVTTAFDAPVGHWSRQAEAADDQLHDPETGAVRGTETQANALIMPNSALSDVTGALNATGEVIITGSIDLPKALASTGSHRPIDGVEVDRLLEQHDAEAPSSDATPVRASRAVSSHTSTRAVVLAAAKPKQSKVPTVLAVSAASVGVAGVVAIVVAFFALHLV